MEYSKHLEQIIIASSSLLLSLIVASAVVKILQVSAENRIKRLLIEEGRLEEAPHFLTNKLLIQQYLLSNLKWALILVFLAFGLLSSKLVLCPSLENPGFYGYLVLFCGFGLALYYLIARTILIKGNEES